EFDEQDEALALVMARNVAMACENAELSCRICELNTELETEIAERKQAQQLLGESNALFHDLFEFVDEGMMVLDRDGRVTQINDRAERMFGWTNEELSGLRLEALMPDRILATYLQFWSVCSGAQSPESQGSSLKIDCIDKEGNEFPAEICLRRVQAEGH